MILSTSPRLLFISALFMVHFSAIQSANAPATSNPKNIVKALSNKEPDALSSAEKGKAAAAPAPGASTTSLPKKISFDHLPDAANYQITPYNRPVYPAQDKLFTYASGKWAGIIESYLDYVLRLIDNGQFESAHSKSPSSTTKNDPDINEHTGRALIIAITNFVALRKKHNEQQETLLAQQREEFQKSINPVFLIIAAASQKCSNGSINLQRIDDGLIALRGMQKNVENETIKAMTEWMERAKVIQDLRHNLLNLHPTAKDQRPISPLRQITVSSPSTLSK